MDDSGREYGGRAPSPKIDQTGRTTVPRPRTRLRASWSRTWPPLLLALVAFCYAGGLAASHSQALSPLDEWVYYDYLLKVPSDGLVVQGEEIGQTALEHGACEGVDVYGKIGGSCGSAYYEPSEFPFTGITSASSYTPLYFWPTFGGARVLESALGVPFLTAGRVMGGAWLAAGIVAFYALLRSVAVSRLMAVGMGLAVIGSPIVYWSNTWISTDATWLLWGSLCLLAAIRVSRKQLHPGWLVLISVIAVLFKVTMFFAVGLACLYLIWSNARMALRARPRTSADGANHPSRSPSWRSAWIALCTGIAASLAYGAWLVVHGLMAVGPAAEQGIFREIGSVTDLLNYAPKFLETGLTFNVTVDPTLFPIPAWLAAPLGWLTVIGVVGALLINDPTPATRALRWPVVISVAIFWPALATALAFTAGYFELPLRYGAPLLPAILLMFALVSKRTRFVSVVMTAYGIVLLCWGLWFMVLS